MTTTIELKEEISVIICDHYESFLELGGNMLLEQLRSRMQRTDFGFMKVHDQAINRCADYLRRNSFPEIRDEVFEIIDDMIRDGAEDGTKLRKTAMIYVNSMIDHYSNEFADMI